MSEQGRIQSLALFPLASVVLFPGGRVPLHIFEPRYRQMTRDVLAGDRRIGMVAIPPEHLTEAAGDPPLYSVGCAGSVEQVRRRSDGRYDLVLIGTHRFRILDEPARPTDRKYRIASVETLEEAVDPLEIPRLHALRMKAIELLARLVRHLTSDAAVPLRAERFAGIEDATFVNVLCQLLDLPTPEKQGLLEAEGLAHRCERLVTVLRFRLAELEGGLPEPPRTLH